MVAIWVTSFSHLTRITKSVSDLAFCFPTCSSPLQVHDLLIGLVRSTDYTVWHCSGTAHLSHGWVFPNCPIWRGPQIVCLWCVKEDVVIRQDVHLTCRQSHRRFWGGMLPSHSVPAAERPGGEQNPETGWHLPKFISKWSWIRVIDWSSVSQPQHN